METSCYRLHLIVADQCDLNILIFHYYKSCFSLEYCYFHILQYLLWCLVQLIKHGDQDNIIMLRDWTSNRLFLYTWYIKLPMHFVKNAVSFFQLLQMQGSFKSSKLKSKSSQSLERVGSTPVPFNSQVLNSVN